MRDFWVGAIRIKDLRGTRSGFVETAVMVGLLAATVAAGVLLLVAQLRGA